MQALRTWTSFRTQSSAFAWVSASSSNTTSGSLRTNELGVAPLYSQMHLRTIHAGVFCRRMQSHQNRQGSHSSGSCDLKLCCVLPSAGKKECFFVKYSSESVTSTK